VIDIDEIIVMPEKKRLPLDIRPGREEEMPVFLEIGFGNGEFLTRLARDNPGNLFWGVEMSRSCVLRALKRVRAERLSNVFLMCGDARFILKKCIPKESLDGIYMNFPCPWPKKKHSKRRVSSGDFPSEIAKVLRRDAFFELVTDEEWYGREVRNVLNEHPALELNTWCANPPRTVTTKYERKWLQMGKNIFLSRHIKKEWLSGDGSCSSGRAEEMHVRVSGKGSLNSFVKELYDRGGENGDALWVYKRSYTSGNGVFLVEVVAGDGSFEQKFFLQIVEREDDILVKIAPYSSPFLTDSVKGALEGLASMIESHCMSHAPDVPVVMDSMKPGPPR
jgi:tRNA (guanine-N7-)-methyltransferase